MTALGPFDPASEPGALAGRRRALGQLGAGLLGLAGLTGAHASGAPQRAVRVVIPFAAGGTADPLARLLTDHIGKKTGAVFVIDSRPGAGGNVGNHAVATAPKDGHTLLLGANNNFVVNQHLFPTGAVDVESSFDLMTVLVDQPQVVYVHDDLPVRSFAELLDYIRARPGQFNYASPGTGTAPHLAGELIAQLYGLKMVHVPYRGGAPAINGLLTGEVQVYFASLSVRRGQIASGKLRALATTSAARLAPLPDVPTTRELGHGQYDMNNWWALAAPKGSPADSLSWLTREFQLAMQEPVLAARLQDMGFVVVGSTPAQFMRRFERESAQYRDLIKARNITVQ